MQKRVVITGTSGLLGPYVARHFLESGYDVLGVDFRPTTNAPYKTMNANLLNLGECYGILNGADAVVHLAAYATMGLPTNELTFQNNTVATYNILEAAAGRGIKKVVIASSECAYGICKSETGLEPKYVPVDEDHPLLPEDPYGLSKVCNEETAKAFNRRCGMQVVAFRFGNVIDKERYLTFPFFINDINARKNLLWNYIDARDAATACRLAIEKDGLGFVALNITEDITSMNIKTNALLKSQYPNITDIRGPIDEFQTVISNAKAKTVLGWQPIHNWRDNIESL